jgi:DNA-binding CsgD family transcriptional regulator
MWRGHPAIVSDDEIKRRNAGRRHYNAMQQLHARLRRTQVARLLAEGLDRYVIAARLDCSERTIRRDIVALLRPQRKHDVCDHCGRAYNVSLPEGMLP